MSILWKNYFFTADFSDVGEALSGLPLETEMTEATTDQLVVWLQYHDPHRANRARWHSDPDVSQDFNVAGAAVSYNGRNHRDLPTNSRYTHVAVLTLPNGGSAVGKRLYLQYFDTEA